MRPFLLLGIALFALTVHGAFAALAAVPDGIAVVKEVGGISEYKLAVNDLNVLLLEDHSAPVLTFMVTYRVGSRNEVTGSTGATHLLEHLMFKGSKNYHAEIGKGFDTMMDRVGGINNASTWLDRTNYYENLPSDHLELAVQLEADRMRNLLLREDDRQPEMTVVRNEFERDENDPGSALEKEINAVAYIAHPYHHPTIGWRSDIEKVSIEKLREFYDTYYWPNNATVTVIGDFKPETALLLIKQYFGTITRSPQPIPIVYTEEPLQTGPRRVTVRRPGEVGVVQIAFKVPAVMHVDHPPLEVLASILSEGKTSRLYRGLIDTNLAISADASKGFFQNQTLFNATAILAPGITHADVEKTLMAELEKVKSEGVAKSEVDRAINKLLAGYAFSRDGSFAIAGQVNETIAVGDWSLYFSLLDKIKTVSAEDVQRVAKEYFEEDQSTSGWFIPIEEPALPEPKAAAAWRDGGKDSPKVAARSPHYYRDPNLPASQAPVPAGLLARKQLFPRVINQSAGGAQGGGAVTGGAIGGETKIASNIKRRNVSGIDVLTLKTGIKDVVTIRGVLNAGDVFNPRDNSAIADLTAGMLDKGTTKHDKFALAALLEEVGATINFGTGTHTLNFTAKSLRKDLSLVLSLLSEQLRTPSFGADEFAKLKTQIAGHYRLQMEDTDFRAKNAFAQEVFPVGHPNRPPSDEKYLADLEGATLEQLKAFHAANFGPTGGRIVAVGDVDDAALDKTLTSVFSGWRGGHTQPDTAKAPPLTKTRTVKVSMPGKTSVSVFMGQPSGLRFNDSAYQSLDMATNVFGGGFFSARLLAIIRNREGLTYGIMANLADDTYTDGSWSIHATFAPELLDKGLASTLRELNQFYTDGLSPDELMTFKTTLTGSYKVALATTDGLASALLNSLQRGYGPEWLDEYPHRIQALTLEDVNQSIQKLLDPQKMILVQAGTLPADGKK